MNEMVEKYFIWIKVPTGLTMDTLEDLRKTLEGALGPDYGFFIVPDRFDILSREEIIEFLRQTLKELESSN